jgi:hypothetical protein
MIESVDRYVVDGPVTMPVKISGEEPGFEEYDATGETPTYRARLTTSEWRQANCFCSLTKKVIDCRMAQSKSAIGDENRR